VGYRAPSWTFSPHTLELIRHANFLYGSSMMAIDQPDEILSNGKSTSSLNCQLFGHWMTLPNMALARFTS
jgi:hypothetical protein